MNIYQGLSWVFIPSASVSPHDRPGSQFEELTDEETEDLGGKVMLNGHYVFPSEAPFASWAPAQMERKTSQTS